MRLKTNDLIEEFSELFPDTDLEQLKKICKAPWEFLKKEMSSDEYEEIRFKYFGKFVITKSKARYFLNENKKRLEEGSITEKKYHSAEKKLKSVLNESN